MTNSLNTFLEDWNKNYLEAAKNIPLFNSEFTKRWNDNKKKQFAKLFYHVRGHFHDFLWYLGNHTNDKLVKDIVLNNIAEELNFSAASHEQMYESFAQDLGVNLQDEIVEQHNYIERIKKFNKGHIKWLSNSCPDQGFAAFSAYERLDNVDYVNLLNVAKNLGVKNKGLIFFKVHTRVEHFETTYPKLEQIWNENSQKVISSFNFICDHQLNMWKDLGEIVDGYENYEIECSRVLQ